MKIVFLGLSITSSWGNGHATTYRGLVRELVRRGHDVLFLERDKPWYAENRDLPNPPFGTTTLYDDLDDLTEHAQAVQDADAVIVGSYVPDGVAVARWAFEIAGGPVCFYDIDTPVTLGKLRRSDFEYLDRADIPKFAAYFSFTGGPTLDVLEREFGSPKALPLYCSVDREAYFPEMVETLYDLSYLGTYSDDRQPTLDRLLVEPAATWRDGRFCVAGPLYPESIRLADERSPDRSPPACEASRFLQREPVDAQRDAAGHDHRRLVAERSAVRGRGVRDAGGRRRVAGFGRLLRDRLRDHDGRFGRGGAADRPRPAR